MNINSFYGAHNILVWVMYLACACPVNCYALISGYVGVKTKYKAANFATLWLKVVCVSIISLAIVFIFRRDKINIVEIFSTFLPAISGKYWYFTAYFVLFLFVPLLQFVVNKIERQKLKVVLIVALIISFISSTGRGFIMALNGSASNDMFQFNWGYSPAWLIMLYLVGGYVGKYNVVEEIHEKYKKLKTWHWLVFYALTVLVTVASKFVLVKLFSMFLHKHTDGAIFTGYISPTVFLGAIFLLFFCSRLKCSKTKKIISLVSSSTFGIYIIHSSLAFSIFATPEKFMVSTSKMRTVLAIPSLIGIALYMFVFSLLIDKVISVLFNLLKVKERMSKLEQKIRARIFKAKEV